MTEDAEYGKTVEALKDVERRKKEQFDVNVKEIIKEVVSSFCLLITKNAVSEEPIQNSSNDHLIPDESERATEVLRKNVKCLEQLLHYSLDFHLKQAVKQLETLSLSWEKVVLEGGFEDNKHIIENKYDEILVLFRKSADLCLEESKTLLNKVINEYEKKEGIHGTANVLINFDYIAIVPMQDILEYQEEIQKLMDQLKFISEDQNSNEREQTVERVEGLIKHWFNREEHIQVKQYELVDAIKGHPADNELRYGIQYLMEKFLSLNIEIDGTTGVSPSCLRYRVYSNLQDIDKLNKMKIPMAKCYAKYKKLAEEMRTFLVKFKPTHNIPPEKRIYL